MRIPDTLSTIRAPRRRKTVAPGGRPLLANDNNHHASDFTELLTPENAPGGGYRGNDAFVRHSSEYITQFIHQELLPDGRVIGRAQQVTEKYQQANQNLQSGPRFAKISV